MENKSYIRLTDSIFFEPSEKGTRTGVVRVSPQLGKVADGHSGWMPPCPDYLEHVANKRQ